MCTVNTEEETKFNLTHIEQFMSVIKDGFLFNVHNYY